MKYTYYPDGKVKEKIVYSNYHDCTIYCYNKQGVLNRRIEVKDNQKNGKEYHYFENGKVKLVVDYLNGELNGKQIEYFPNGKIEYLKFYKNNKLHGVVYHYHETGEVDSEMLFINGKQKSVKDYLMSIDGKYFTYVYDTIGFKNNSQDHLGRVTVFYGENPKYVEEKSLGFVNNGYLQNLDTVINNNPYHVEMHFPSKYADAARLKLVIGELKPNGAFVNNDNVSIFKGNKKLSYTISSDEYQLGDNFIMGRLYISIDSIDKSYNFPYYNHFYVEE